MGLLWISDTSLVEVGGNYGQPINSHCSNHLVRILNCGLRHCCNYGMCGRVRRWGDISQRGTRCGNGDMCGRSTGFYTFMITSWTPTPHRKHLGMLPDQIAGRLPKTISTGASGVNSVRCNRSLPGCGKLSPRHQVFSQTPLLQH